MMSLTVLMEIKYTQALMDMILPIGLMATRSTLEITGMKLFLGLKNEDK